MAHSQVAAHDVFKDRTLTTGLRANNRYLGKIDRVLDLVDEERGINVITL